ncbi:hypothetical protein [Streptomyces sp. NPDC004783]|uniref:hypothetical protein n=1 Tax=Streptomyces sp. NPDC004783 TaxID=3154459 RepID=UPI0033A0D201
MPRIPPLLAQAVLVPMSVRRKVARAVLAEILGPIDSGTDIATWTTVRAIQLMNEAGKQRDDALAAIARVRDELSACEDDDWMVRAGDIRVALAGGEDDQ